MPKMSTIVYIAIRGASFQTNMVMLLENGQPLTMDVDTGVPTSGP